MAYATPTGDIEPYYFPVLGDQEEYRMGNYTYYPYIKICCFYYFIHKFYYTSPMPVKGHSLLQQIPWVMSRGLV